ncbi:MAG: eight-cysteine-cluster domain-containing protein [Myxococcota bacterium]
MLIVLVFACAPAAGPPPESPAAAETPVPPQAPPPAVGDPTQSEPLTPAAPVPAPVAGDAPPTARQLYEGCKARVEGVETAGECQTDADCARAGCSQEVCVAKAVAPDVMTTCELLPCSIALDTCGCHDGLCTWTIKEGATLMKRPAL